RPVVPRRAGLPRRPRRLRAHPARVERAARVRRIGIRDVRIPRAVPPRIDRHRAAGRRARGRLHRGAARRRARAGAQPALRAAHRLLVRRRAGRVAAPLRGGAEPLALRMDVDRQSARGDLRGAAATAEGRRDRDADEAGPGTAARPQEAGALPHRLTRPWRTLARRVAYSARPWLEVSEPADVRSQDERVRDGPTPARRYASWSSHARDRPVMTTGTRRSSDARAIPQRKTAVRSSSSKAASHSMHADSPLSAACNSGRPTPTAVAPSASAFAASSPLRTPPVAMTGSRTADAPTTATAVGRPQSRKRSPRLMRSTSPADAARSASIAANDVPPTPPTSMAETPRRRRRSATAREIPAPVSFAITGTGDAFVSARTAAS